MSARPTIAVVGASARATAFSLLRADCEVVAADLFADADLQRECPVTRIAEYPEGLVDWLAQTKCDGWLYTGALENYPELIDRMAKMRPLLGNDGAVLRRVRDPLLLQDALRAAELNFPETKLCDGSCPGQGAWLHKTGQGGNGSGVSCYSTEAPLPATGYWQRRIQGVTGSAQFVGDRLYGITRQLIDERWTGAGQFQYGGTLAPWNLRLSAVSMLAQAGRLLASQSDLRGLFGIDFVFDGERVWIVEVNPRVTAAVEVVERVTGEILLAQHLAAFGHSMRVRPETCVPSSGKAIIYAKQPLAVSRSLSEQLLSSAGTHGWPLLADIPTPNTQMEPAEPILTVLADGANVQDVEAQLRERVVQLESQLYREGGGQAT